MSHPQFLSACLLAQVRLVPEASYQKFVLPVTQVRLDLQLCLCLIANVDLLVNERWVDTFQLVLCVRIHMLVSVIIVMFYDHIKI